MVGFAVGVLILLDRPAPAPVAPRALPAVAMATGPLSPGPAGRGHRRRRRDRELRPPFSGAGKPSDRGPANPPTCASSCVSSSPSSPSTRSRSAAAPRSPGARSRSSRSPRALGQGLAGTVRSHEGARSGLHRGPLPGVRLQQRDQPPPVRTSHATRGRGDAPLRDRYRRYLMTVGVIGTGHVGAITCLSLASMGHRVVGCDADPEKVHSLATGRMPFHEPGAQDLLREQLAGRELDLLARDRSRGVGCRRGVHLRRHPRAVSGEADLLAVEQAARDIAGAATGPLVVVEKSTVPAGTAGHLEGRWWRATGSGGSTGSGLQSGVPSGGAGSRGRAPPRPDPRRSLIAPGVRGDAPTLSARSSTKACS